uniref:Uncharacterized protein n=1 Tax=Oryza barthii TaxID=65489 RepID=A0A0D3GAT9_9ORYZ
MPLTVKVAEATNADEQLGQMAEMMIEMEEPVLVVHEKQHGHEVVPAIYSPHLVHEDYLVDETHYYP